MPRPSRVGSLEVAEDLKLERRSWRIERVGWALMALLALAGLAGLFGSGPLSEAEARAGAVSVGYPRFARALAPQRLEVSFGPAAVRGGEARVWLARSYHDHVRIARVVPEPRSAQIDVGRIVYVFALAPQQQRGTVIFHLQFDTFGLVQARVGAGEDEVAFRQLVYP